MCGIAGILYWDEKQPEQNQLNNMVDSLFHRGPDGYGTYIQGSVGLIHTRLSIIDTSEAGKQPMTEGALTITYNGEIFNYKEIRQELASMGIKFNSTSDTEVVLKAYATWGAKCFSRFNGMWALAIWDDKEKKLILSRDRFGVKPLYYTFFDGGFIFASEAKAIFSTKLINCEPNWLWWHQYINIGYVDTGMETFFEGVKLFPKASYAIVEKEINFEKFWNFDLEKFRKKYDYGNPEKQFRDILKDSISLRLRSDVSIGSCLSGGMDSSSIVCMATEEANNNFHTFSAYYTDLGYNEKEFAEEVNIKTGAIPHYLNPTSSEAMMFSTIGTYYTERPCSGPTLITQLNVMREAHKHVKVVLDGQGVDEYLAGYHSFYLSYIKSLAKKIVKRPVVNSINFVKALFSMMLSSHSRDVVFSYFIQKLPSKIKSLPLFDKKIMSYKPIIHEDFKAQYQNNPLVPTFDAPYEDELNNVLYQQFFYVSIPALLLLEDANSMAFSVEARLPFMDYRMVEFIFGLEMEQKISGWKTKAIMRKALKGILPDKVLHRKDKKGYPTPYANWLRSDIKPEVEKIIFSNELEQRKLFSKDSIKYYWDLHQTGKFDYSWIIYKILSSELWFRIFIDKTLSVPTLNKHQKSNKTEEFKDIYRDVAELAK